MGSSNRYFAGGESSAFSFVNNLTQELESLPPLSSDCWIYRVRNRLRAANEEAYTPQVVSIGPLHHGKEALQRMEEHKKRYLKSFLRRTTVSLEVYDAVVRENEMKIRLCYADSIKFSSEKLREIILVDAAFVIELFLRFVRPVIRDDVDLIYLKPRMLTDIVRDLLMLENQLPFFILHDLFEIANRYEFIRHHRDPFFVKPVEFPQTSMIEISHIFFKSQLLVTTNDKMPAVFSPEVLHFVHLFWNLHLPERSKGGKLKSITVPTITELHQAGVKFEKGKSTNLFNITFKDGILTIPTLTLQSGSETLFRNLLAFEDCHYSNYFTDYFVFMQHLVRGPEDLKLLVKCGIVENLMGDNESSTLIKELADEVGVNVNHFYFASECEEMSNHCRASWNRWKANLRQNYFNTPWAGISVLAAFALLLLTLIQTICDVYILHRR